MSQTKTKPRQTVDETPAPPASVTPDPTTLPAITNTSAMFDADEAANTGAGVSTDNDDNLVPRMKILQKGSPQVNERDPAYIEGARPGMLLNTGSAGKLYNIERSQTNPGSGVHVLHVAYQKKLIEWTPRSAGGGFVAIYDWEHPIRREAREIPDSQNPERTVLVLPNGHELKEHVDHYVVLLPELTPCIVGLTSSGWRFHKEWNTLYADKKLRMASGTMIPRDSWHTLVRLQSIWLKNDRGDWFAFRAEDCGLVRNVVRDQPNLAEELRLVEGYQIAKMFDAQLRTGLVRAADPDDETSTPTREGTPAPTHANFDDEAPL